MESASGPVPHLTTAQMIEVDRAMMEDYQIGLIQMMENAGRNLAQLARERFLSGDALNRRVVVLAGTGGNGGGALVAARRLHNWGAKVTVVLAKPAERLTQVPAHQWGILQRMKVPSASVQDLAMIEPPELILDGLIGYSLKGPPRDAYVDLIEWANAQSAPKLALDVPSGIDAGTGTVYEPAIQAAATLTLALPKEGLRSEQVASLVGELYLADISVPPELYSEPALGLTVGPIFHQSDIVRLG